MVIILVLQNFEKFFLLKTFLEKNYAQNEFHLQIKQNSALNKKQIYKKFRTFFLSPPYFFLCKTLFYKQIWRSFNLFKITKIIKTLMLFNIFKLNQIILLEKLLFCANGVFLAYCSLKKKFINGNTKRSVIYFI